MLSYTDPAITVLEADAYAVLRGWTDWTGADALKNAAIRRGQDYIAGIGNGRWATEWDNDHAPEPVQFAIIEAARRELVKPGSLAPDVTRAGQVSRKKVKAGPVETETQFSEVTSASDGLPVIAMIDRLLSSELRPSGGATVDVLRV